MALFFSLVSRFPPPPPSAILFPPPPPSTCSSLSSLSSSHLATFGPSASLHHYPNICWCDVSSTTAISALLSSIPVANITSYSVQALQFFVFNVNFLQFFVCLFFARTLMNSLLSWTFMYYRDLMVCIFIA